MRTLSAAARQAVFAQNTDQVFLILLVIDHPDLVSPIRIVNNTESIVSNGDTYLPYAFRFDPPDEKQNTITNAKLTIENIDRQLMAVIREIEEPPSVEVSIILADSPNTVEAGPLSFVLRDVPYNAETISGILYYEEVLDLQIPGDRFTPKDYGGLH